MSIFKKSPKILQNIKYIRNFADIDQATLQVATYNQIMGRLIKDTMRKIGTTRSKKLSKGQRLGWSHRSDCEPVRLRSLSSQGETLCTYTAGPFAANKLLP